MSKSYLNFPEKMYDSPENMDKMILKQMSDYNIPGASVSIIEDNEVKSIKHWGVINKKDKIQANDDTIYQLGSLSKPLTTLGILKLVEDKIIDLDDPVKKHLKSWSLPESQYDYNEVTIRRILSHTAGFNVSSYPGTDPSLELSTLQSSLSGNEKYPPGLKLLFKPGSRQKYSGGGYTLLQLMIEDITGMTFSEYMKQNVFIPLNMTNTSFTWENYTNKMIATPYSWLGYELPNYIFSEKAAASLKSTPADMTKFLIACLDPESISNMISPDLLRECYKPISKDFTAGFLYDDLDNNERLIMHKCANRGWRAMFVFLPEQNDGIIYMSNYDGGADFMRDDIASWVKSKTGSYAYFYRKLLRPRKVITFINIIIGLPLIFILVFFTSDLIIQRRNISFKNLKVTPLLILKLFVPLLVIFLLWFIFYAPLHLGGWAGAFIMPAGFREFSNILFFWFVLLWTKFLFVKYNK